MTIGDWLKKNTSTILTCLGAGGVVATVALAIRRLRRTLWTIRNTTEKTGCRPAA